MRKTCVQCAADFEAKRSDTRYCCRACKQAGVRARQGVRVSRRPPDPPRDDARLDELTATVADLAARQTELAQDVELLEHRTDRPAKDRQDLAAAVARVEQAVRAQDRRLDQLARTVEQLAAAHREQRAQLAQVAQFVASEPWRR